MKARSRVRGARGFRKLLRKLPQSARDEMAGILSEEGDVLLRAMRSAAPVRSGALRAGLDKKLLRAALRLRVGLVGRPGQRRKLFYGFIVEVGRKAQTATVRRGRRAGAKVRVRAMAPRPFVLNRRPEARQQLGRRLGSFWDGALADAARGTSDD